MADVTATERIVRDGVLIAVPGSKLSESDAARLGVNTDGTKDTSREDVSPYNAPAQAETPYAVEIVGANQATETTAESSGENAAEKAPAKKGDEGK